MLAAFIKFYPIQAMAPPVLAVVVIVLISATQGTTPEPCSGLECDIMVEDDFAVSMDLLALKPRENSHSALSASTAWGQVGNGICKRGYLGGLKTATDSECRQLCEDEEQCQVYSYGQTDGAWQCLTYDAGCGGFQNRHRGKDLSMYTCYEKPASSPPSQRDEEEGENYICEDDVNYRSTGDPEDLEGSIKKHDAQNGNAMESMAACAALCDDTDQCNVFVYNKYGECYLKTDVTYPHPDPEVHETVSCRKQGLNIVERNAVGVGG